MDLSALAEEVGRSGPVTCVGGRTQWDVGGPLDARGEVVREVGAPAGIEWLQPDEMTVRCGAGTPVEELAAALAEVGQRVALPDRPGATVGGLVAVGHSGLDRLGRGPLRDAVLQAGVVTAAGEVAKVGGPTVKNVTGYDLCRLLVGSIGTLAVIGEVILRTWPLPAERRWFAGEADPFVLRASLFRPASVLWDGTTTWVCLEGHAADVAAQAAIAGLPEVAGPPEVPESGRWSLPPGELRGLAGRPGRWVAEVGVGLVHLDEPAPRRPVDEAVLALHRRLKDTFDPVGRLNPGRDPLRA